MNPLTVVESPRDKGNMVEGNDADHDQADDCTQGACLSISNHNLLSSRHDGKNIEDSKLDILSNGTDPKMPVSTTSNHDERERLHDGIQALIEQQCEPKVQEGKSCSTTSERDHKVTAIDQERKVSKSSLIQNKATSNSGALLLPNNSKDQKRLDNGRITGKSTILLKLKTKQVDDESNKNHKQHKIQPVKAKQQPLSADGLLDRASKAEMIHIHKISVKAAIVETLSSSSSSASSKNKSVKSCTSCTDSSEPIRHRSTMTENMQNSNTSVHREMMKSSTGKVMSTKASSNTTMKPLVKPDASRGGKMLSQTHAKGRVESTTGINIQGRKAFASKGNSLNEKRGMQSRVGELKTSHSTIKPTITEIARNGYVTSMNDLSTMTNSSQNPPDGNDASKGKSTAYSFDRNSGPGALVEIAINRQASAGSSTRLTEATVTSTRVQSTIGQEIKSLNSHADEFSNVDVSERYDSSSSNHSLVEIAINRQASAGSSTRLTEATFTSTRVQSTVGQEIKSHKSNSDEISNGDDSSINDSSSSNHDMNRRLSSDLKTNGRNILGHSSLNSLSSTSSSGSLNNDFPSDSLSAARRRRSSLLENFQNLLSRTKTTCLANYNNDFGDRVDRQLIDTISCPSGFMHYSKRAPIVSTMNKTVSTNDCEKSANFLDVKQILHIDEYSISDPSVTIIVLEDNISESLNDDVQSTAKSTQDGIENLQRVALVNGKICVIKKFEEVARVMKTVREIAQDQDHGLSRHEHSRIPLTDSSNLSAVENKAIDIQRTFRGYLARQHALVELGVAKRRKWEKKSKGIKITRIHSKFRRLARAELRIRASSGNYCTGGGSMVVAIRRVCAIRIQRMWHRVIWTRHFEQRLLLKREQADMHDKEVLLHSQYSRIINSADGIELNRQSSRVNDPWRGQRSSLTSCHERYPQESLKNTCNEYLLVGEISNIKTPCRPEFMNQLSSQLNSLYSSCRNGDIYSDHDDRSEIDKSRCDSFDDRCISSVSSGSNSTLDNSSI